jgi:hypothetical protein
MKKFKEIDCWISVSLLLIFGVISLATQSFVYLIRSYFIIGGWQVISMVVHTLNRWFMKRGGARSNYHWFVLSILGIVLLSFFLQPLLFIFVILLVGSPVLALIYTKICFDEVKELKLTHSLNLR